jgi:hypothetical protein
VRFTVLAVPLVLLAVAAPAVAGPPTPHASAISVTVKQGFAIKVPGPSTSVDVYDVGEDSSVSCKGGGVPLAVGWSGVATIVDRATYYLDGDNPYARLELRRPMTAGSFRPLAICAKGKGLGAKVKTSSGERVSCGNKLPIGVPMDSTWPYSEQPIVAAPDGLKAWHYVQPPQGRATAICVNAGAFSQVKVVKKTAAFAVGAKTASVSATCAGQRRPVGWGYEAPTMDQNVWDSLDTTSKRSVPFISASTPSGAKGWKLTFTTPDQLPEKTAATVGLNVTCAVPE